MAAPIVTAAEIAQFREDAESMMTLTLTPQIPNGKTTVNDQETFAFVAQRAVRGKVSGQSAQSSQPYTHTVVIAGVEVPVVEEGLHIPISAPIPKAGPRGTGWEYVVTKISPTDDPALLGRRYLVTNPPAMSHATARRLDVAEVPQ